MAKKEIVQVNLAAGNPNLSPATRFGNLVFVAGQTGGTHYRGGWQRPSQRTGYTIEHQDDLATARSYLF